MKRLFNRLFTCICVSSFVLLTFKLEMAIGLAILRLDSFLPLVSAISACLIYSIKNMLSEKVVGSKIIIVFFASMTFTSFFLFLGPEIYYLSYLLPLFELRIWDVSYGDIKYGVLCMDDASKGSPSKINTIPRESSPTELDRVQRLDAIYDSVKELSGINSQLEKFTNDMKKLKDTYDIKVLLDSEDNIGIDLPGSISNDKAHELSRKVGVIDRLILTQYDKFDATLKSVLQDKEYLMRHGRSSGFASIDKAISNHDKIKNTYKSLQDKD